MVFCLLCGGLEVLEGQPSEGKDVGVGVEMFKKGQDVCVVVC